MKKLWLNLALGIFGLVFSLVLLEVAVRLYLALPKQAPKNDRGSLYFMPEGVRNMRGNLYDSHKPEGVFRIHVVGDSFSFGPQMQFFDTFPLRLQRMLNLNKDAAPVEVINLGSPGFATKDEIALVERAVRENSDLIVLQITLNDAQVRELRDEPEAVRSQFGRYAGAGRGAGWFAWWKTLQLVLERIHNQRSVSAYTQYHLNLYNDPETFGIFRRALEAISNRCKQAGVPLVAVIFPLFDYDFSSYPLKPVHDKIAATLKAMQVPALDLLSAYARVDFSRMQIAPGSDSHPNEIAHRIAADQILTWLVRKNFVPKDLAPKFVYSRRIGLSEIHLDRPYSARSRKK